MSDITYEYDCIFEKLVEELQPYDFVVNCRGNLVNLRHIEKIKGFIIYMDNGKELQIAQRRSNDFREEVNKFCREIHRRKMNTILLVLCNALSCFIISTILFQFMNGKYKRVVEIDMYIL